VRSSRLAVDAFTLFDFSFSVMSEVNLDGYLHRQCGGHYLRSESTFTLRMSGMTATVPSSVFRCDRCGDEQFTVEQRESAERAGLAEIRTTNGLLAPREIRSLRERLGLTTVQLGELLYGVPKGLIEGWEKGRYLQNREADAMLRSLDDRETLESRASRAGVILPQVATVGPTDSEPDQSSPEQWSNNSRPSGTEPA
jgi:putative zinc finger/helix-turn-helix YgiT family protein